MLYTEVKSVPDLPPKLIDHTIVQQAPTCAFEARSFASEADGHLYVVLRHPRENSQGYSYYVLLGIGTHDYREVEEKASARAYLGVPAGTPKSDWWDIWPEK